mmetsp:Transcript_4689/g.12009  ORF Transcript_4689/g.12009 Transcript_4689/m.12009 type:complete len:95 (+) Transcript_4689:218-502(+)
MEAELRGVQFLQTSSSFPHHLALFISTYDVVKSVPPQHDQSSVLTGPADRPTDRPTFPETRDSKSRSLDDACGSCSLATSATSAPRHMRKYPSL